MLIPQKNMDSFICDKNKMSNFARLKETTIEWTVSYAIIGISLSGCYQR